MENMHLDKATQAKRNDKKQTKPVQRVPKIIVVTRVEKQNACKVVHTPGESIIPRTFKDVLASSKPASATHQYIGIQMWIFRYM